MAQHGSQYGKQTDEYGNPIRQTDEYGNPISRPTAGGGGDYGVGTDQHGAIGSTGAHKSADKYGTTGTTGAGGGHVTHGGGGTYDPEGLTSAGTGNLRRSGSSSSSSSEDDGQGGRRKKGLKEKVKEKLPGGGHKTTAPGYGTGGGGQATTGTGAGGYGTTGTGGYGGVEEPQHEKKGMMEKIKEKLPGGHQ
ncbi:hypothetical protein RD792_001368 [Penstemon davidsonii]|uniref:Dehydrin n=1 Tax=Penstemon davidsonii TaxID=160366 RepID=A0ABR0DP77_9LAMI|nr:hypothetical protein RD792_001368 [Penstemon davidsonii]